MSCGGWERELVHAIAEVDAQAQTSIDRASGKVVVQSEASREALSQAIQEEGYTVA